MLTDHQRVVVTGIGAVTPVGNDVASTWDNLVAGRSGVGTITAFDASHLKVRIAAEVKGFDPLKYQTAKDVKKTDRFVQFGIACAKMALEDSKLDLSIEDVHKIGILVGSGIGGLRVIEEQHKVYMEKGASRISPFLIPMLISVLLSGVAIVLFLLKKWL